jgi:hypothetical protein
MKKRAISDLTIDDQQPISYPFYPGLNAYLILGMHMTIEQHKEKHL